MNLLIFFIIIRSSGYFYDVRFCNVKLIQFHNLFVGLFYTPQSMLFKINNFKYTLIL